MDVDRVYEEHVRSLPLADRLRLAARIVAEAAASAETSTSAAPPDPSETSRWDEWLRTSLDAAGDRIAAAQREMQARGILDAEGKLISDELPADMRPGSTSSVATG